MSMKYGAMVWLASLLLMPAVASGQENPEAVVSAAVREAGHACAKPKNVKRDPQHSKPDEAAWTIQCEDGNYRVRFMGDRGAKVEPVGK